MGNCYDCLNKLLPSAAKKAEAQAREREAACKGFESEPREGCEAFQYSTKQVAAFNFAVSQTIPNAIPADLDAAADLEVGRVLLYRDKPKAYVSSRKQALEFARDGDGNLVRLFDLLPEQAKFNLEEQLQETRVNFTTRTKEEYLYQTAADLETKVKLSLDFGLVSEVSSNLDTLVNSLSIPVSSGHVVIEQAKERGGVIMVVSKVYLSERASIQLGDKEQRFTTVYVSPKPTTIAYLLMRLRIGEDGVLTPVLELGPTPHSQAQVNIDIRMSTTAHQRMPMLQSDIRTKPSKTTVVSSDTTVALPDTAPTVTFDFQEGPSNTYRGVIYESNEVVKALVENGPLQNEFLHLVSSPHQRTNLDKLIKYLQSVQEAMQLEEQPQVTCPVEVKHVADKITQARPAKKKEIKALLAAAEAFKAFTPSTMKTVAKLSMSQRKEILDLIDDLPFGSTRHVWAHEAFPENDLVYHRFLRKMGFVRSGDNLGFIAESDSHNLIAAGVTAMLAGIKQ